jgi:primosomal protein N'
MTKVMANDYQGLVRQELMERKNYRYPPFDRLIRLTLRHSDERKIGRRCRGARRPACASDSLRAPLVLKRRKSVKSMIYTTA